MYTVSLLAVGMSPLKQLFALVFSNGFESYSKLCSMKETVYHFFQSIKVYL